MFKRKIEKNLYDYYKNKDSRILIVEGARQVGKSFIIRETVSSYFNNYIEIDLKTDFENKSLFKNVKSIDDFYLVVSVIEGNKLDSMDNTIIFLDEISFIPILLPY